MTEFEVDQILDRIDITIDRMLTDRVIPEVATDRVMLGIADIVYDRIKVDAVEQRSSLFPGWLRSMFMQRRFASIVLHCNWTGSRA